MGDAYRGSRAYRDRDSGSDDERYKSTTVTRYKVTPGRGADRYERTDRIDVDDDRRSRFSGRLSGDLFDDRRNQMALDRPRPDHPRSDYPRTEYPRSEFEAYAADRPRSLYYERERDVERDVRREPDRMSRPYEDWERRSTRDVRHDDEVKVERKVEERLDDDHGHEIERYRKETEYFVPADPPPAPVIIRQQAQEPQKIIVQEAPSPAPIVVPRQQPGLVVLRDREQDRELVRRDRDPYEEDYYYRHERRDVGPYRGDRDYALSRYEHRRHRGDDYSYYSDDDDHYVRRTVIRRERSDSAHRHKRELAEGALAGAGITALVSSRRDEYGDLPENRGRKVLAGAALGALGTEALRRAHSAYEDRWGDGRESPDHHSRLRKGLGLAAVALAAAGAAKYYQSSKIDKEEAHRGRSRTRGGYYSHDEYSRSVSRVSRSPSRTRSRRRSLSTAAKTALGGMATAGIIRHLSKSRSRHQSRSRSRSGSRSHSRSKSKLRRGAEIAGAAAAAGVAGKLWKNHQDKKEARERSASRDDDRDHYRRSRGRAVSRSRSWSRSRSRSRSMARSPVSASGADPELGLIEYGRDPLPSEPPSATDRGYDSQAEGGRRRRRRRRERSLSASPADQERKRSRSRLRDMAAAGAAAVGIKEFKDRRDQEKREKRSRERDEELRSRSMDEERRLRFGDEERSLRERTGERRRKSGLASEEAPSILEREPPSGGGREKLTRRDAGREDERRRDGYFDDARDRRPHSPPTASGGAYYPPYPSTPGSAPGGSDYAPYPDSSGPAPREYRPYVPQDYTGYAPPPPPPPPAAPPGPPPGPEPSFGGIYPPTPPGPPPPGPPGPPGPTPPPGGRQPPPPDHVSDLSRNRRSRAASAAEDGVDQASLTRGPPSASKSVTFIPLSPKSSRTMERHRREQAAAAAAEKEASPPRKEPEGDPSNNDEDVDRDDYTLSRPAFRRRRSSDPSSDRPILHRHGRLNRRGGLDPDEGGSGSDDVEELPDRFDDDGRPLGRRAARGWTTRQGTFERRPRRPGDWDVRGAWQVGGSDGEAVERLVRDVTGALDGRRSWASVLGQVLSGGLLAARNGGEGRGQDLLGGRRVR